MAAPAVNAREFPLARLTLATALAACAGLLLVACLLLWRRLSGAIAESLSSGPLLSAALVLLSTIAGLRWAGWELGLARASRGGRAVLFLLPALAVLVSGFSLSLVATPWTLALLWMAILAEEVTWWLLLFRRHTPQRLENASTPGPSREMVPTVVPAIPAGEPFPADDAELLPANVIQQMTRVREAGGEESLHGVVRGTFAPGERTQNLHLAFCPPLSSRPQLSFEQIDGPPASIKAGQVESFGARLEVRLDSGHPEPAEVLVEFSVVTSVDAD